jgi:hypothetical protein
MGVADAAAGSHKPSLLAKLWPAFAVVGGALAIVAGVYVFRTARSTTVAAVSSAPEAQVVAAPEPMASAAPEPEAEEPKVAAITPGQRMVKEDPPADPSASATPVPVAAAPRVTAKRAAPKPAQTPAAPKPPVNTCDLKCQMQRALAKKH